MPKANTFSDDAILTALQTYQTVAAAANAVGCSKRTIYSRMQHDDFRARLAAYRAERVRAAAATLDAAALDAVTVLRDIANSPEESAADRIRAALAILDMSPKYETRLAGLENQTANAAQKLDFGLAFQDIWEGLDELFEDEE